MSKHSAFYVLSLLMILVAPVALAQPAPGNTKEQRQSSTARKMPAETRPPDRGIKSGQQEAKDHHNRKMQQADTELAMGASSASQGMGSGMMQPKKSSSPGKADKSVNKPAAKAQPGALKK